MTSSSTAPKGHTTKEGSFFIAPYIVPPIAASAAIIPVFRDMIAKSAQQKGMPIPSLSFKTGLKEGIKAAPTVGAVVGLQMIVQNLIERTLSGESDTKSLSATLISSAIVGTISSPLLAIFNGQTLGWTVRESCRKFSARLGVTIAIQETACVGGLSVADLLATAMKKQVGDKKAVDYTAAFISGAAGGLIGHPANTALTRWQNGMTVDSFRQLMWGSMRRARGVGMFSVIYKLGKEILNS